MKSAKSRWCKRCEGWRRFEKVYQPWNVFHLLMCLMTMGLWLPVLLAANIGAALRGWGCNACGKRG